MKQEEFIVAILTTDNTMIILRVLSDDIRKALDWAEKEHEGRVKLASVIGYKRLFLFDTRRKTREL